MKHVLVFDLDDTLYNESDFVKSGFMEVSHFLAVHFHLNEEEVLKKMLNVLELKGRGHVFDDILKDYHIYSKKIVRKCLSIYRLHRPNIHLSPEGERCLERFAGYPQYILTDGNKIVQHNKLAALGLYQRMKKCIISHRHGRHYSKPSPYCMELISSLEKVPHKQVVYIGDNPNKDFVGIKPLGFRTIRLINGMFRDTKLGSSHEAHISISSLDELTPGLLNSLFNLEV